MVVQFPGVRRQVPRGGLSLNAFILVSLVIFLGGGLAVMDKPPAILTFLFILAAWVLSVVVHEFSHAFVAWHAGDDTVLAKGYLSLDPLKYADLLTSLILPVVFLAMGGIGFPGAAVYLQEDLMRSRTWRSLSSLAGPMGTLAVLIVIAVILKLGSGVMGAPLVAALAFLAFLQATSLILNLLPVPGLDGYGVIRPFLPQHVRQALRKFEPIAFIGLFAILWLVPIANTLLFLGAAGLAQLMGVQFDDVVAGMQAFRFWKAL